MRFFQLYYRLSILHIQILFRHPFFLLMTLATVFLTLVLPLTFSYTFGDTARRLARDGGLAFQLMAGIAIAATAAGSMSGRERQSRTQAMILSKPVSPTLLFLAHYTGIAALLLTFSVSSGVAILLADRIAEAFSPETGLRIDLTTTAISMLLTLLACIAGAVMNARSRASFHSFTFCILPLMLAAAAGLTGFYDRSGCRTDAYSLTLSTDILMASVLIAAALLMFCAIALTLSLVFQPVTVTLVSFAILAAGLSSGWLTAARLNDMTAARFALYLLPDWQRFWIPAARLDIPPTTLAMTLLYALIFTAGFLTIGSIFFEQSEHGK
jgi:hypothetical protein